MIITQILSRKNVKKLPASLLSGMAASLVLALGLAGCSEDNSTNNVGNGTPSPVNLANLETFMVPVEGGTFTRGCREGEGVEEADTTCLKPAKDTAVAAFYICKFEVTQGLWKEVMGAGNNPSVYKGDNLPVNNVKGSEISGFITALNTKTAGGGYTYRLPSEAEWEYAARGGASGNGHTYSGSDNAGEVAWYGGIDGSISQPQPVGAKPPNELGIYDMSGNVWEVAVRNYNPNGSINQGAERGGSWFGREGYCRVTYKINLGGFGNNSSEMNSKPTSDRGFRIAAVPKP